MTEILLEDVLPMIFSSGEGHGQSLVWQTHLSFQRGTSYLIRAESGRGKTSLMSFLYGLRTDYLGRILFDGKPIASLGANEWVKLRRSSLALLPQELGLFPQLSALANVELKNQLTQHKRRAEILELFARVELTDKLESPIAQLSIGQRQRVAALRMLCQPASFFLLDEPVSHLDERNNRLLAQLIAEEARRQGAGIIATSVGNPLLLDYDKVLDL